MKTHLLLLPSLLFLGMGCSSNSQPENEETGIRLQEVSQVKIDDSFWTPKFQQWSKTTANDVFDKFEGKHLQNPDPKRINNTFENFDRVAKGERNIGQHAGEPWFDGLVYETIRGVSDLMAQQPDKAMEQRIDGYIDRIEKAQSAEPDGYINTYTQMIENEHRWGENGGMLRFQHDVYNAGMLVEAGVHYYKATGKTKLLEVATRFANMMCDYMGPAPKKNVVPAHSGTEEPLVKLYWLYKNNPELKSQVKVPVNEQAYFELAEFWIENRGKHCGLPLWGTWGNPEAEQWIKDNTYSDPTYGEHTRPTWGDYAQDSIPVFQQQTIEGHAVRATLLATGIAAAALENQSPEYIATAQRLWDNMVGKRMFITGGVGAVHFDEKFGPDYFLPTDAYLETCAAVGVGFFSQRLNELTGDGKYMDEFERSLYNNVLTGISLSGDHYTYQNPLNAKEHARWEWHGCPCCPPMFLKIVSAVPSFIYAHEGNKIYVNLFIGSETQIQINKATSVQLKQDTRYPWDGAIALSVNPNQDSDFTLKVRIPGWARGVENPYDLYKSNVALSYALKVNGSPVDAKVVNGYAEINRKWTKGDKVELSLPMQPRVITANDAVADLRGKVALASGPLVYCLEKCDNENLSNITLDVNTPLTLNYKKDMLNGINVISGKATGLNSEEVTISAIPYYAVGNREGSGYETWIPGITEPFREVE